MTVRQLLKGLFVLTAMFALSVFLAPNVQASPITSISGGNLAGPTGGGGSNFSFDGSVAAVSGTNPNSGLVGTHVNSTNVDLSNFTSNGGPVTLAATYGGSQTLSFDSGSIVFTYSNPAMLNYFGNNDGEILDTLTLTTNTSGYNLATGGTWSLVETFNGIGITPGSPGSFTVPSGTSGASFTLSFVPTPTVPEPASLALWGVVGLVGAWYGRRKLQRTVAL